MSAKKTKRSRRRTQRMAEFPPEKQYQTQLVEVVNDGAIAGAGAVLGKLVPVIIVDARDRPDLRDVVAQGQDPQLHGDVTVAWGRPQGREFYNRFVVSLLLHFIRPIDTYALLLFDVQKTSTLIDLIIRTKYLYFQAGSPGDRLGNTLDSARILVEVPHTGFEKTWDRLLYDSLVTEFRSRGLDKKASASATKQTISTMREFQSIRLDAHLPPREPQT